MELKRRLRMIEEALGELHNLPPNERVQIVTIPYEDRGEAFEKTKRERLKDLQREYGNKIDINRIIWIGVLNFAGDETDPL